MLIRCVAKGNNYYCARCDVTPAHQSPRTDTVTFSCWNIESRVQLNEKIVDGLHVHYLIQAKMHLGELGLANRRKGRRLEWFMGCQSSHYLICFCLVLLGDVPGHAYYIIQQAFIDHDLLVAWSTESASEAEESNLDAQGLQFDHDWTGMACSCRCVWDIQQFHIGKKHRPTKSACFFESHEIQRVGRVEQLLHVAE